MWIARKNRYPFDTSKLYGYFLEMVFELYGAVLTYLLINQAPVFLLIGICLHHKAFYQIFQYWVTEFDIAENKPHVHTKMCELIKFHTMIKE